MYKIISLCCTLISLSLYSGTAISSEMKIIDKACINNIKIINQTIATQNKCLKNSENFSLNDSIIALTHNKYVYLINDVGWRLIPIDKCCNNLQKAKQNYPTPIFIERASYKSLNFNKNINVLRMFRYGRKYLVSELCILLKDKPPSCFSEVHKELKSPSKLPSIESLFKPTNNGVLFTFKTYNYLGGGSYEFYSQKYIISENKIIKQ